MYIRKKNVEVNKIMMWLLLIGMSCEIIGFPLQLSFLVSVGVLLIRIGLISGFLAVIVKDKFKIKQDFLLILLLLVFSILSIIVSGEFQIHSLGVLFSFVEIPLFMYAIKANCDYNMLRNIYILFIGLSGFFIMLSFMPFAYDYYTQEWGYVPITALTLGYNNPNQTAMYLFCCVLVLLSAFFYFNKKNIKVFLALDLLWLIWLIYCTESRAIFIALIFVVVFMCIQHIKKSVLRRICFGISLAFVPITLIFEEILKEIMLFGFRIETGRANIYKEIFEEFNIVNYIFGNYSLQFKNLHNGFFSIFATIGILATVCYIIYLNKKIRRLENSANAMYKRVAWLGILAYILHAAAEAAMLTFGEVYAVCFCVLYYISNINIAQEYNE